MVIGGVGNVHVCFDERRWSKMIHKPNKKNSMCFDRHNCTTCRYGSSDCYDLCHTCQTIVCKYEMIK
jgi:hypothetical protein